MERRPERGRRHPETLHLKPRRGRLSKAAGATLTLLQGRHPGDRLVYDPSSALTQFDSTLS